MYPFEEYLKQYHLEALTVSIVAQVRYVTVWNATKGKPVTFEHAWKIRQAVLTLTHIPYTGPFVLIQAQPIDQTPTLPIKQLNTIDNVGLRQGTFLHSEGTYGNGKQK